MTKIAFVFPGQGSQSIGMGKGFYEKYSSARRVIDDADDKLSFDLKKIIFDSSIEELTKTVYCQPAIYVISMAILTVIKEQFPSLIPNVYAGHSLGEYTALTAAGSITFDDCLDLVVKRSEFMQKAAENTDGTMLAVIGCSRDQLESTIKDMPVSIANINTPQQMILSGGCEDILDAENKLKAQAKKLVRLKVSGAFHSPLMDTAQRELAEFIRRATITEPPFGSLIMNVTGEEESERIKENLIKQVTHPVEWVKSIERANADVFIEIGPGKVLSGLIRKISKSGQVINVGCIEDLKKLEDIINE